MILEHLREGFDKYALNPDNELGWPWQPYLHRISAPETMAHDHPGNFTSTVVRGRGYNEEVFKWVDGQLRYHRTLERRLGDRFEVKGETVHRIVTVLGGEVWTLVEHEPNRREAKVYEVAP